MGAWLTPLAIISPAAAEEVNVQLLCTGHAETFDTYAGDAVTTGEEANVRLSIRGQEGEASMPRLIGGAKQGTLKFKAFSVEPSQITGKINYQGIGNAKVRLDRTTGLLTIRGPRGNFSGKCSPADPSKPVERLF
jgi:hypothetical protein